MAAWHELFPLDREPTMEDIAGYIDHPLWDAFTAFIDESYGAKPRIEYSRCGGAPGWNVKYKARGRALCTVYPRDGFFISMVSVGSKEKDEAEALLATADPYVRALYERSADSSMGRWLMIEITSEGILRDAEALMLLRAAPKGARS